MCIQVRMFKEVIFEFVTVAKMVTDNFSTRFHNNISAMNRCITIPNRLWNHSHE